MKEKLLAGPAGPILMDLRQWLGLKTLPVRNPEKASLVANSILAERLVARLCAPGGNFLDIGAHIGSITALVRRHVRDVKISAIEADTGKFENLRARFPECQFINCAVGESAGEAKFYRFPDRSGFNTLVASDASGAVETIVEVRTLDDLFPDQVFDVIKIDIEGAELGAFKGGEAMIAKSRPTVMFESTGTERNALGYAPEDLHAWFLERDFEILLPDHLAHDAPPMERSVFLDAHHYPTRSVNFFAVAKERRIEIRDKARRILGIKVG